MTKAITAAIVIVLLGCIGLPVLLLSAVLGGCTPAVPHASGQPSIGRWATEQVSIAATIMQVGATKGIPRWGRVVALATAMQESQLRNLPHLSENNDHDSIGVFQQRPSQGWGTPEQLADPAYQAGRFYDKLLTVPGWQQLPLTVAAQRVQVSAYPNAYTKWTGDAILLADALTSANGQASPETIGYCGATGAWTQPVLALIVSGFRVPARPGHDGVDLGAARGTPIRAASAGVVSIVRCNVVPESHGCDQDGHPVNVKGCGWYVDIDHANGIVSRYCHMLTRPYVESGEQVVAGQVIGLVGSSGHSSGPHLHYEIHLHDDHGSSSAVDPEVFMRQVGAPLGAPVGWAAAAGPSRWSQFGSDDGVGVVAKPFADLVALGGHGACAAPHEELGLLRFQHVPVRAALDLNQENVFAFVLNPAQVVLRFGIDCYEQVVRGPQSGEFGSHSIIRCMDIG